MVSQRILELQQLQSQAQNSRQNAVLQQKILEGNLEDAKKQSLQLEQQKRNVTIFKRPTPWTIQAQPSYTRQVREQGRQFLADYYPTASKQIQEYFNSINTSKGEIQKYLDYVDSYTSQISSAISEIEAQEQAQKFLDKGVSILNAKGTSTYKYMKQVYKEEVYNEQQFIKQLSKEHPNLKFYFDTKNVLNIKIPELNKTFTSIDSYNRFIETYSKVLESYNKAMLKKSQMSSISTFNTDIKLPTKNIKFNYETRGTESKIPPVPLASMFTPIVETTPTQSFISKNTKLPATSRLFEQDTQEKYATKLKGMIDNTLKSYISSSQTQQQKNEIGKIYQKIFNENLKITLRTENQIEKEYSSANSTINTILSKIYVEQRDVDVANQRIKYIINEFNLRQKKLISSANSESINKQQAIISQAEANLRGGISNAFSTLTKKYIPEGLTLKQAQKNILLIEKNLRAQGFSESEIQRRLGDEARLIRLKLQLSSGLIPIRERPLETLKSVGVTLGTTAAIVGVSTYFPATAPAIKTALTALLVPTLGYQALQIASTPQISRGEKKFEFAAQLAAGLVGAKIGGSIATRFKANQVEVSKISTAARLSNKELLQFQKNLSQQEFTLFEKLRATATRIYQLTVKNPNTKTTLNYVFLENARYRGSTLLAEGGDRVLRGFAFDSKGRIIQRIVATFLEGVNTQKELTLLLGDNTIITQLNKTGGVVKKTLSGTTFRIEEMKSAEIIGKANPISEFLIPTKTKITIQSRGERITLKTNTYQKIRGVIEVGLSSILKGKSYIIKGKANADALYNELLKKYSSTVGRMRIPSGARIQRISMIPRGRETLTLLEFSIVQTLGTKAKSFRVSFRIPTSAYFSNLLNINRNSIIFSSGKTIKIFEVGNILSPEQFKNLFLIFSRIKSFGMKSLSPNEVSLFKIFFQKLRVIYNQINLRKLIDNFGKKELVVHEGRVLDNFQQLESIYAGRGTYELSDSTISQFLAPTSLTRPLTGMPSQLATRGARTIFRTQLKQPLSLSDSLSGFLVGKTQIRTQTRLQDRVGLLSKVLQRETLTQSQRNQLVENHILTPREATILSTREVQGLAQQQLQQLKLQQQNAQQQIQTQRTITTTPTRSPLNFLLPIQISNRRKEKVRRKSKKEVVRKRRRFERKPTVFQSVFGLKRKFSPPTRFLTGFEKRR